MLVLLKYTHYVAEAPMQKKSSQHDNDFLFFSSCLLTQMGNQFVIEMAIKRNNIYSDAIIIEINVLRNLCFK